MRRSSLSICLNIAEGSAKRSDKDFNRYIEIALGSINETVAAIDLCFGEKLLTKEKFDQHLKQAENITRQLGGFSRSLKKVDG
jgi:four helix bundle protein